MYVVVETGGKQYKVAKNDEFIVERLECKDGSEIKLDKIMLAKDGNSIHIGSPYLKGVFITCIAIGQIRQPKVTAFKYKRRKSEKKTIGHRQAATKLKVKEIVVSKS